MTDLELKAMRELVYVANEVADAMASHPDAKARDIAGDANDPDEYLARLIRAIQIAGPLVHPAWGYRHADEQTV